MYDKFVHSATINSHRLCAKISRQAGMDGIEPVTSRLKALRKRAQPRLSVRKMAESLGLPPSTYAAYEDPAKFKKPILPLQLTQQIAGVLTERGIDEAEVLELAGITGELTTLGRPERSIDEEEWITVTGAVAAGIWRAQTNWPLAEQYEVRFGPSEFPKEQRFGLRMDGLSMNKTIPPGSDLECLYVRFSPIPPRPGDLVIAERHVHDLVELTCKRLAIDGDEYVLLSESTEPEFQEPIRIGRPDADIFVDNEVRVVGIVLSAKLDLAPRDLSQRRYKGG